LWKNESDKTAVINVESFLLLNGFCDVAADSGLNSSTWNTNTSSLDIFALLSIYDVYLQSPPPTAQIGQLSNVLGLSAKNSLLGDYESSAITGSYDLIYKIILVHPQGVRLFEVTLGISFESDGGYAHVDFATGDFKVVCPPW
jgi:hypothetical protein